MNNKVSILALILFFISATYGISMADDDFTWQDCIKEASVNHPDLIAAGEVIKESQAGKNITASTLYPQVTGSLNASTGRTAAGQNGNGNTTSAKTSDSYSYGVSGTQLVFDGLKTINSVKAAGENIKASEQSYKFTSTEVRLSLRTAFVNLLRAQQLIHVT